MLAPARGFLRFQEDMNTFQGMRGPQSLFLPVFGVGDLSTLAFFFSLNIEISLCCVFVLVRRFVFACPPSGVLAVHHGSSFGG